MEERQQNPAVNLGMFARAQGGGVTLGDAVAAGLSVLWLIICAIYFLRGSEGGSAANFLVASLAVVLPVAVIWVAAIAARSLATVREETLRLQNSMDVLRQNMVEMQQTRRMTIVPAAPTAAPAGTPRRPESSSFTTRRGQTAQPAKAPEQANLALDPEGAPEVPPLTPSEFISALNFPKNAEDRPGFRALKRAMADPHASRLVQAAQDVLTLLSQEGIYMDDLAPDRARPEIWRKFAEGQRGRAVAMLGGIRDRSSLALAAQRMRSDHIFRDAAHHFLRQFDRTFAAFAPDATDAEIVALTDTRSARAFMLLGRVAGTFD